VSVRAANHAAMVELPALAWTVAGVRIAFSTIADGDLREPGVRTVWLERLGCPHPCQVPGQVHGVLIADADDPQADLSAADGLVSQDPRRAVGVFGADCPGLILIAPDALGAAHCGWRGTAAGIVEAVAGALAGRSRHPPAAWQAVIGPGISGPCYEVDGPVLEARAWPAQALTATRPGRAQLDLAAAIAADCRTAGITQVTTTGVCTACDPRLHSFRHQGKRLVQALVAWRC
jgi:copper oxidase (laccase) domain-containing protein